MPRRADVQKVAVYQPAPPAEIVADAMDASPAVLAALHLSVPDCATTEGCPAAGRGHWLRHVDKDGQRTTVTELNGIVWNRACPVPGCTRRVFG